MLSPVSSCTVLKPRRSLSPPLRQCFSLLFHLPKQSKIEGSTQANPHANDPNPRRPALIPSHITSRLFRMHRDPRSHVLQVKSDHYTTFHIHMSGVKSDPETADPPSNLNETHPWIPYASPSTHLPQLSSFSL